LSLPIGVIKLLLKKYRLKNGWTQSQVATMLGVSERYYRSIEAGDRKLSYKRLIILEDIFKLPQRILFAESIEEVPEYYRDFIPHIFGTD